MNARGQALAITWMAMLAGCTAPGDPRGERERGSSGPVFGDDVRNAKAEVDGSSRAPTSEVASSGPSGRTRAPVGEAARVARPLDNARIIGLTAARAAPMTPLTFEATLEVAPNAGSSAPERGAATLSLASMSAPVAYRRPLAFYRLAAALGLHIVPEVALRALSVGELSGLLQADPRAIGRIRSQARVQNDGTVDALLTAPSLPSLGSPWTRPRAIPISPVSSVEVTDWERWAASPTKLPEERSSLLRDFVELLVLDYLAAVVIRKKILFFPDAGAILLDDNRDVFPLHADAAAIEPLLLRLRGVARFPRGLQDALSRFDRETAKGALAPGSFEGWLLSPRSLIDLDERRISLLSLIEAQVAARGAEAVLGL